MMKVHLVFYHWRGSGNMIIGVGFGSEHAYKIIEQSAIAFEECDTFKRDGEIQRLVDGVSNYDYLFLKTTNEGWYYTQEIAIEGYPDDNSEHPH
jgi:hypothetical protein